MKKLKQLFSLMSEAKIEPGGQDAGKLFGPRGKFAPKKGPKEPTAAARVKSGNITPNINRPSGLSDVIKREPPEEAKWIEPTARARMSGVRTDLGEPIQSPVHRDDLKKIVKDTKQKKENDSETQRMLGDMDKKIDRIAKKEKETRNNQRVVPFTNTMAHYEMNASGMTPTVRTLMKDMKQNSPGFKFFSDILTDAHAQNIRYRGEVLDNQDRARSAHHLVDTHFSQLKDRLQTIPDGKIPLGNKFYQSHTMIDDVFETPQSIDGTRTLTIKFKPLKKGTVNTSDQIRDVTKFLKDYTGHHWSISPMHFMSPGSYNVGSKQNPLQIVTNIHHPDLIYYDDDGGGGGGGRDDFDDPPMPDTPKGPSGKKIELPPKSTKPRLRPQFA